MSEGQTSSECRNCSAPLSGPYCAQCGQAVRDARAPIVEASGIVVQQSLGTDARFWSTLINLMFKPGRLTNEFLAGKQRRSLHPIRLFLIASAIALLTPDILFEEAWIPPQSWDNAVGEGLSFSERFEIGKQRLIELRGGQPMTAPPNPEMRAFAVELNRNFLLWALLFGILATVPVLKLIRPRRLLYDHLVFALHFGCFAYFSDLILRVLQVREWAGAWPQTIIQCVYLTWAFRRVYAWRTRIGLPVDILSGVAVFVVLEISVIVAVQLASVWMAMPH